MCETMRDNFSPGTHETAKNIGGGVRTPGPVHRQMLFLTCTQTIFYPSLGASACSASRGAAGVVRITCLWEFSNQCSPPDPHHSKTGRPRRVHLALRRIHQAPPPGLDIAEVPRASPRLLSDGAGSAAPGNKHLGLPRHFGSRAPADGPGICGGRGVGRTGIFVRGVDCTMIRQRLLEP